MYIIYTECIILITLLNFACCRSSRDNYEKHETKTLYINSLFNGNTGSYMCVRVCVCARARACVCRSVVVRLKAGLKEHALP
jgi:hypothetical protein